MNNYCYALFKRKIWEIALVQNIEIFIEKNLKIMLFINPRMYLLDPQQ